jgi:hypothetical protein
MSKEIVLEMLYSGMSEAEVIGTGLLPDRRTLLQWCDEDDDFKIKYDQSKLLFYNAFADKLNMAAMLLLDPESETTKIYADKVKRALEVFQVTAAKQAPSYYGVKPIANITGNNGKNMSITVEFVDSDSPVTDDV